jgi:hypothetical protein
MTNALFATSLVNVSAIQNPPVDTGGLQQSPILDRSRYDFFLAIGNRQTTSLSSLSSSFQPQSANIILLTITNLSN